MCSQSISLGDDVVQYASKHIRLEKCGVFRLDMPGRRVMAIRARISQTLCDVVSPILARVGMSWSDVVIHIVCNAAFSNLIKVLY